MTEPGHLTEFQLWMLRDALSSGAVYFASRDDLEDGMFPRPNDPKGKAIPPHDTGQKRIIRKLVSMALMREDTPARFLLTDLGRQIAMDEGDVPIRRSF